MDSNEINQLLHEIWLKVPTVSSELARLKAQEFGALASLGYITTQVSRYDFGRQWRLTPLGLNLLKEEAIL